jgi:hypothetical protein
MTHLFDAVQGVLTILLMVAAGYLLSRKGWFTEDSVAVISRLVIRIAIPALMLSNLTGTFDRESIIKIGPGFVVPLGTILFLYGLSIVLGRLLGIPKNRRGVFRALFSFSNTMFVGLPVNIALFGDASVPYVTLFYIVNTTIFWTLGVYFIRKDNEAEKIPFLSLNTLRRIVTPTLICFFIAIGLVLLEIRLPKFIMSGLKYTASMTTPLSMLIIGITIHSVGVRGIRINREMIAVLAGRFIAAPATAWFILGRMEAPDLMRKVFLVVAAMPVMTQIAIVGKAYGADHRNAGVIATVTTAASLVVIPFYMFFFGG